MATPPPSPAPSPSSTSRALVSALGIKLTALMLSMFDGCPQPWYNNSWYSPPPFWYGLPPGLVSLLPACSLLLLLPSLSDTCSLCKIFALPDKATWHCLPLPSPPQLQSPPATAGQLHCVHFMADNLMPGKAGKAEKRCRAHFSLRCANLIGLQRYMQGIQMGLLGCESGIEGGKGEWKVRERDSNVKTSSIRHIARDLMPPVVSAKRPKMR